MKEQTQTTEQVETDYFKKAGISNSMLSKLNPEEGGSPWAFKAAMDGTAEELESKAIENGTMVHLYAEHPDKFEFSDIDAPSEMAQEWVEAVFNNYPKDQSDSDKEFSDFVVAMKEGLGLYKSTKDREKVLENWNKNCEPYYQFLKRADGKICLTRAQKETIDKSIEAIKANPKTADIFSDKAEDGWVIFKELEIFAKIGEKNPKLIKGKLDKVKINVKEQQIVIQDIKTGSFLLADYPKVFEKRHTYRQIAMYTHLIGKYCEKHFPLPNGEKWDLKLEIIAVSTKEFKARLFDLSHNWIDKGQEEAADILNRIDFHEKFGYEMTMEEYQSDGEYPLLSPEEIKSKNLSSDATKQLLKMLMNNNSPGTGMVQGLKDLLTRR
jgi:hypothetical protein